MRMRLHFRTAFACVCALVFVNVAAAQSQNPNVSSYLEQQIPVQQFVSSEPDQPPVTVYAAPAGPPSQTRDAQLDPNQRTFEPAPLPSNSATPYPQPLPAHEAPALDAPAPNAPAYNSGPPVVPTVPMPAEPAPLPVPVPLPSSLTPNGGIQTNIPAPVEAQPPSLDEQLLMPKQAIPAFQGGLKEADFIQCEKMTASVCSLAKNKPQFQTCMNHLKKQPGCTQFLAFAELSHFSIKDDMDVIQPYPQANLILIHITREGGATGYPGDYYTITTPGYFVNINSGLEAQAIDIKENANYPEILQRYPKVQLWSIIDKLPIAEPLVEGYGVRLIFAFQLFNGCDTCGPVGTAYVAYDYGAEGILKGTTLLSLQESTAPMTPY